MPSANPVDTRVFDLGITFGANPGAGNPFVTAGPGNARIELLYFEVQFTALTAVADRYLYLTLQRSGTDYTMAASSIKQVLGDSFVYSFVSTLPEVVDLTSDNIALIPMPDKFILEPGDSLYARAINQGGADVFINGRMRYKTWTIA